MAIYKRDIADINLETGNIHRTFLNHSIGSGDNNANAFGVRLFRDNEPVNIGSGWVQGFFRNSHGENIALTQHGVIDGNEAYVTLPQACYNYEGQFTLAIKIVSPGSANTVTMRIVDGIVDNTNTGSAVAPTGTVPTYQEVLAAYEQAVTVIDKSVRFDTTQSLTDTQKATARTNIGAASVGTANELAMDIGALAEGFANESYMDLGNKYMPFRRGYYSTPAVGSTSSYQSNSQYFYALVMCQPGDILHAHCYGNSTVYAWAFLDSNLNVLSRGGTGNFEGTQTAPASTSYVLVNVDISHMSTGFYAWVGKESTGEKISDLKSAISDTTDCVRKGLIPYACNGSSTNAGFTVSQNGNNTTLTGTSTATSGQAATKILLSDHIQIWDATSVPDAAKVYPIELIAGHKYKITGKVVSGTRDAGSGAGTLTLRFVNSSGTLASAIIGINDTEASAEYTSTGTNIQVRALVARLMTVTSLVVRISVEDITVSAELDEKQNALTFDSFPAEGSNNPVKSNGISYEIEEIRDAIGTKEDKITGMGADSGYYWNAETSTAVKTAVSTYKAYGAVSVNPGERYKATGLDADSSKQYMVLIVDENYTILAHYGDRSNTTKTYTFSIPDNASYVLMTTKKASVVNLYKIELNEIHTDMPPGLYDFNGKNIAIIGDSISTNGDWSEDNPLGNVPEIVIQDEDVGVELSAYATFYDIGTTVGGHEIVAADVGTEITFTPVDGDIGKIVGKPKNNNAASVVTWWEVAQAALGFNPIPVCWSGSSITDHEENVYDSDEQGYIYKCAHAFHPSQIRKCGIRTPGTMTRTAPDMVIIYRGTNDFSHAPITRLTDMLEKYPFSIPATDVVQIDGQDKYGYLEGLAITVNKIHEAYPEAMIVICTFNYFHRMSSQLPGFPSRNSVNTIYQYNDAIRAFADYFGCHVIEFDKDGITYANAASGAYYQEGTSTSANHTHPNTKGHKVMGNRALRDLMMLNNMT